jgi:hypothetical protein
MKLELVMLPAVAFSETAAAPAEQLTFTTGATEKRPTGRVTVADCCRAEVPERFTTPDEVEYGWMVCGWVRDPFE